MRWARVALAGGQCGTTRGQCGAREPRRRLIASTRARIVFLRAQGRAGDIYNNIAGTAVMPRRVEGCERFAIFKRRARVRIPTRSVSKCDCCATAAACSLTPHASRLTQIQLTAAGFCAPQLLFARAGISLGSAVVCWSSFVAPRVAFSCMQHQQLLALVVVSCKGLWSRARATRTLAWVAHGEARRGWCRRRGATRASRAPAARSAWRQGAMAVSRAKKKKRVQ